MLVFFVICVSCANFMSVHFSLMVTCRDGSLVCCDLLCFDVYCIVFRVLLCLCLVALWSPARKGLTSGLSNSGAFLWFCHFPI